MSEIPYKIYLEEKEMPTQWYNVRADMKKKPAPLLNPETLQPIKLEDISRQRISIFQRRYVIFIGCIVLHHWFVHIV